MSEESKKACRCGHEIDHVWVSEQATYTMFGWILFLCGITALPKAIVTKCGKCGFVFSSNEDLEYRKSKQF